MIATASVAQSGADNLSGEDRCWGTFAFDVVLNTGSVAIPALGTSRISEPVVRTGANLLVTEKTTVPAILNSRNSDCS